MYSPDVHRKTLDLTIDELVQLKIQRVLDLLSKISASDGHHRFPSINLETIARIRLENEQSVVDREINDICILMQCSRHNINVALSKRIHYGKFVAEAKFRDFPAIYEAAIEVQDRAKLMELLTYESVEAVVKKRVEMKTQTYGQEVKINQEEDTPDPVYKIKPSLVANLYGDWIMPLTFLYISFIIMLHT